GAHQPLFFSARNLPSRVWVGSISVSSVGLSDSTITVANDGHKRGKSIEALETYAHTGEIPGELQAYIQAFGRHITPEQLEKIRPVLLVSAEVDVVTVSQFLHTVAIGPSPATAQSYMKSLTALTRDMCTR
ncbi:MAG: alpha/beta hydrolase, partial [Cyanobacteria bacterium J06559_3]